MSNVLYVAEQAGGNTTNEWWGLIAPFAIMFAVFYFLLIRPQQKRTKARNAMLAAVKKGDKVTTIGGIHGSIVEITDDIVVLKVNDTTRMTFERSAINSIKSEDSAAEEKK